MTVAGLVGDRTLRPGEVSLAHNGVLFLDEAPEFGRAAIEVLREPLEDGRIRLARAMGSVDLPAAITLVMACNPCPCGLRGTGACRCVDGDVLRYLKRLSGPILDRVDLYVELAAVPSRILVEAPPSEPSQAVRERVVVARDRQRARGQTSPNARICPAELAHVAALDGEGRELLVQGSEHHGLSGRATSRVLRVARTLADLEGCVSVSPDHIVGALAFRPPAGLV